MTIAEGDKAWIMHTTADLGQELTLTITPDPGVRPTSRRPCTFDICRTKQTREGVKDERRCEASYRAPVVGADPDRLRRIATTVRSACAEGTP